MKKRAGTVISPWGWIFLASIAFWIAAGCALARVIG